MTTDNNHGSVDKSKLLALIPREHRLPGAVFFVVQAVLVPIAVGSDQWVKITAIVGMVAVTCFFLFKFFPHEQEKSESHLRAPESHAEGSIGVELDDYHSAVIKIKELLADHSGGRHSLKFLVITGRRMMQSYLSEFVAEYEGHVDIQLQVVDPMSSYVDVMPEHWGEETKSSIKLIKKIHENRSGGGTLKVWKYSYLPCINGELINENHLILCYFGWDPRTEMLGDSQEQYFYYYRNSKTSNVFKLFESWFNHAPKLPWETNVEKS